MLEGHLMCTYWQGLKETLKSEFNFDVEKTMVSEECLLPKKGSGLLFFVLQMIAYSTALCLC